MNYQTKKIPVLAVQYTNQNEHQLISTLLKYYQEKEKSCHYDHYEIQIKVLSHTSINIKICLGSSMESFLIYLNDWLVFQEDNLFPVKYRLEIFEKLFEVRK